MNWLPADDQILKDFPDDNALAAQLIGCSEAAVRGRRQRLGLVTPRGASAPDEILSAVKEAPECPIKEAAKEVPIEFGKIPLEVFDDSNWTRFGMVSDTHLCCRESRLDALQAQYNLFAKEGITTVFHGGNIVDGYVPRINGGSVLDTTIDGQAQYVIDHYPRHEGITTHFITGDDHEGWWQKEGFNFGAYLQMLAQSQGRNDLNYIGHVEGDVELKCGNHSQVLKIQHPGGGSAYARSYKGQKMVESLQGGEKPAILAQGHYHVSGYSFDRSVHIIGLPGFQDQTIFGRKKHLRFEIGGVIVEFKMSKVTGAITRFRSEFTMYFDRGFYKPFLVSDAGKPHLTIQTGT
jgi:hypothetical protein